MPKTKGRQIDYMMHKKFSWLHHFKIELTDLCRGRTGMRGAADIGYVSVFWEDESDSQIDGNLFPNLMALQ